MTGISKLPELFYDTLARTEHKFLYLGRCPCWGSPKPRTVRFASRRTRLTAWLFRSLQSLFPAHPRRKFRRVPRLLDLRANLPHIYEYIAAVDTSLYDEHSAGSVSEAAPSTSILFGSSCCLAGGFLAGGKPDAGAVCGDCLPRSSLAPGLERI